MSTTEDINTIANRIMTAARKAKLSPSMIVEQLTADQVSKFDSEWINKANKANSEADWSASHSSRAYGFSACALATNEACALEIIAERVAAREAAMSAPMSDAAQRALRGED